MISRLPPADAISPEHRLLLEAGRNQIHPNSGGWGSALCDPALDWDAVMRIAHYQRVFPILYKYLAPRSARVPADVWRRASAEMSGLLRRNLRLTGDLLQILSTFNSSAIPALPFKGPVLAAAVYGGLDFREFADLDVLVRRDDLPGACEALLGLGFRPALPGNWAQEAIHLKTEYHFPFVHQSSGSMVELHAELMPHYFCFDLNTDGLLERAERIELAGMRVLHFAPGDLVLALAAHGTKHRWEWLEFVFTLAKLVQTRQDIRWDDVLRRARSAGALRMLAVALVLAEDLTAQVPPPEVAAYIEADEKALELAADAARVPLGLAGASPLVISGPSFHLRSRERWRDRARYCLRLALSPNAEELEWMPLPSRFFPLYRILRPARAALGSAAQIAHHFRGKAARQRAPQVQS